MLNLKHHSNSSLDFLASVITSKRNSKEDPTYINRIKAMESIIKSHFEVYDASFDANSLQDLISAGYAGRHKEDLLALYSYHSVIMQKLKTGITTTELKRVISTCQNCTIGEVNSFDHMVPQTEFPEFVVHPKNLFPSCTKCNSYKSSIWRQKGDRLFLNLYIDQLPQIQYLSVVIKATPGDIDATFTVANPNGINIDLFRKISYHYEKLHLCDRFAENIDKVVTPLKHSISSNLQHLTVQEATEVALNSSNRNRMAFGFNYWKSMLEIALLSCPVFLQMCENEK